MSILKIALLQLLSNGFNQEAALEQGEAACRQAQKMGADIALFPEMWNIGYKFFDPKVPGAHLFWQAQAIRHSDPFVRHFWKLARELDMAIALTYLEEWQGAPRNSVSLIDRHGEILFTYAKIHTCDFDVEGALTPGDDFYVACLDTAHGPVQVGAMICFDREFPESARLLMLKGAEIILTPNACEMEANRMGQLRARAYENMLGVALANYAGSENKGHSAAFDCIAFGDEERSRNTCLVEAGEEPGVYLAEFDLEALRHFRQHEAWGNAYRKPSRYGLLVSKEVSPPFIRPDARR